jgi:hypothetical protein
MASCDNTILTTIPDNDCLAQSRQKLNNNFNSLEDLVCDLKKRVDKAAANVRTFFYYGPNGQDNPRSGMDNNNTSRPSNITIEAFVNGTSQLNLPAISYPGDTAYVVYQKTGYSTNAPGSPTITELSTIRTRRVISRVETIPWYQNIVNQFSLIFIIWKLTYDGTSYTVNLGFPKFAQAQTDGNQTNWNNPQSWTTF